MELGGEIIGFINCCCAHTVAMSDDEFKELVGRDPLTPKVVIKSVVFAPEHHGKGSATVLMREFVEQLKGTGNRTIHNCWRFHFSGRIIHLFGNY